MSAQGRKDWDYVTFADYKKDTDDLVSRATSVAEHYQREIKNRDRLIHALVKAAGGKIVVRDEDLQDLFVGRTELVAEVNYADKTRVYRIMEKP